MTVPPRCPVCGNPMRIKDGELVCIHPGHCHKCGGEAEGGHGICNDCLLLELR